jgi:hypothetical protein
MSAVSEMLSSDCLGLCPEYNNLSVAERFSTLLEIVKEAPPSPEDLEGIMAKCTDATRETVQVGVTTPLTITLTRSPQPTKHTED